MILLSDFFPDKIQQKSKAKKQEEKKVEKDCKDRKKEKKEFKLLAEEVRQRAQLAAQTRKKQHFYTRLGKNVSVCAFKFCNSLKC